MLLSLGIFFGCHTSPVTKITHERYEILLPENHQQLLILFPGYFGNSKKIQAESPLVTKAVQENVAVLLLNLNGKLLLTKTEKQDLAVQISTIINENHLKYENMYLGGFSSGGNLALLLAKYLETFQKGKFKAKGVFVIDSPVDLVKLYTTSQKTIRKNYSQIAVSEAKFIIVRLKNRLGNPVDNLPNYERFSPFVGKSKYLENIRFKTTEVKIFTEPAPKWNKKYRGRSFDDLNAFQLKQMANVLTENDIEVGYFETMHQGVRSDGMRHPHSWSILDEEKIVDWMLSETP